MQNSWLSENEKLQSGEITKKDYDNWRYHYPRIKLSGSKKALIHFTRRKNNLSKQKTPLKTLSFSVVFLNSIIIGLQYK
jgi:hypothetical protein